MDKTFEIKDLPSGEVVSEDMLLSLSLHQMVVVFHEPAMRILRVQSGWLYNFWDYNQSDYFDHWVFVPEKNKA